MTGDLIDVEEALRIGLADHVAHHGNLNQGAMEYQCAMDVWGKEGILPFKVGCSCFSRSFFEGPGI